MGCRSGQAVRTFTGDGILWATAVAFSPDGSRLIVTDTQSARVYDTSSGAQTLRFVADGDLPVVSADGRAIAGTTQVGDRQALVVVNAMTGASSWTVPSEPGMEAFAVGADGRMLATLKKQFKRLSSESTAQIEIWDLIDKVRKSRFEIGIPRSEFAFAGALSADGKLLAFEDAARNVVLVNSAS